MHRSRFAASVAALALALSSLAGPAQAAQPSSVPIPPFTDVPEYRANTSRTGVYPGPGPVGQPVLVWSRTSDAPISFPAILADGVLLVASTDRNIYALDARTGADRWRFQAADQFTTTFGSAADGTVVAASADGILHALDLTTGIERWSHPGIGTGTDIVDGVVYAPGTDNHAYGLDLATGEVRWSWAAPASVAFVTVADGTAYVSVGDGRLYAISLADSTEQWHVQTLGASPAIAEVDGDGVYVSVGTGDSSLAHGSSHGDRPCVGDSQVAVPDRHGQPDHARVDSERRAVRGRA